MRPFSLTHILGVPPLVVFAVLAVAPMPAQATVYAGCEVQLRLPDCTPVGKRDRWVATSWPSAEPVHFVASCTRCSIIREAGKNERTECIRVDPPTATDLTMTTDNPPKTQSGHFEDTGTRCSDGKLYRYTGALRADTTYDIRSRGDSMFETVASLRLDEDLDPGVGCTVAAGPSDALPAVPLFALLWAARRRRRSARRV